MLHQQPQLLALAVLCAAPCVAHAGDTFTFRAEPGARVLKTYKLQHELRIDDMGVIVGDLPFVSDKSGGWISSSHTVQYLDEYSRAAQGRPLDFKRHVREATGQGKANVTRQSGEVLQDNSRSVSPLKRQNVEFRWVEAEGDWSRCYEKIDAEEEWLAKLRGEFELLALLPPGAVEPGDSWKVELESFRSVLVPGGDLLLTPQGDNLFGRLMELGVGGDFADFYAPQGGVIEATYRGRRAVTDGAGEAARNVEAGVIELALNITSRADRTQLYRMAMPQEERREPSRLEEAPIEYTLNGKGELLWDFERGRALSLSIEGQEGFVASVTKTRFDGASETRYAQRSVYSGPLRLTVSFEDGAGVGTEPEKVNPKIDPTRGRK